MIDAHAANRHGFLYSEATTSCELTVLRPGTSSLYLPHRHAIGEMG
jgi:hypothetical protein